ncbi:MAG: hypothetical protein WA294_13495 [Acidobacteriaceae bacterium]
MKHRETSVGEPASRRCCIFQGRQKQREHRAHVDNDQLAMVAAVAQKLEVMHERPGDQQIAE